MAPSTAFKGARLLLVSRRGPNKRWIEFSGCSSALVMGLKPAANSKHPNRHNTNDTAHSNGICRVQRVGRVLCGGGEGAVPRANQDAKTHVQWETLLQGAVLAVHVAHQVFIVDGRIKGVQQNY